MTPLHFLITALRFSTPIASRGGQEPPRAPSLLQQMGKARPGSLRIPLPQPRPWSVPPAGLKRRFQSSERFEDSPLAAFAGGSPRARPSVAIAQSLLPVCSEAATAKQSPRSSVLLLLLPERAGNWQLNQFPFSWEYSKNSTHPKNKLKNLIKSEGLN